MNVLALTAALEEEALRLGFDLVGATPAVAPPSFDRLRQWLADGFGGQMRYFEDRLAAYRHPDQLLDGVRSVLMLGMNYRTVEPAAAGTGEARVSRYAWGADYHEVIRHRLHQLADLHRRLVPAAGVRGVVDTAPLLERQFGQLAGLGWIGKNTMLINERFGSWFFLAALLSTEELAYDNVAQVANLPYSNASVGQVGNLPHNQSRRCGSCRACLDACPTGALLAPYCLDARRCISYLTIELRGPIPAEFQAARGNRLFGCDACQEACPWNRRTPVTKETALQPGPGMNPVRLADVTALDDAAFRQRFRHTPLWRARREGILRNAEM